MSEAPSKINVPILIASFVLSIFLWAVVYAQNLPIATRQMEVELVLDGLDTTQFAITKRPDKLRIWVTGSEQQLNELRDTEKFALVDLSQPILGKRVYEVRLLPNLLRQLATDSTPEVTMEIEPVRKREGLKVMVQTSGRLPNDELRLDRLVVDPKEVSILGPQSLVESVAQVRVRFDLSDVDPQRKTPHTVLCEPLDDQMRPIDGVKVQPTFVGLTPVLIPSPQEKTANVLVRFKGSPAPGYESAGYRLDADNALLMGPSFALATLSSVSTEDIDLTGLTGPKDFTVKLKLPPGVTDAKPSRVKVRVLVRPAPAPAAGNP